ncbi:MAG: polyprenyl synthetase family protein, partial [Kiritimatiellae bacterium]|nr:polyprenyl synthetase family protein [Kiritimatiellia bacterium]
ILCLAACKAICGDSATAMYPAMAIEILHTYTLVHDDLPSMDDDIERRGKPTVHVVYGEANAVLTGDALQALAFELIANGTTTPAQTVLLIKELAIAAGSQGVVGGQVEDLAAIGLTDKELIHWIHLHKTADLFYAAMRMGGIAANASEVELTTLGEYGQSLGLAFQIIDDILDEEPTESDNSANETQNSETTCLAAHTPEEAKVLATSYINKALTASEALPTTNIEPLKAIAEFIITRTI